MADAVRMQPVVPERVTRHRADWSAVWAGVFTFAGIWIVFEALALSIFGMSRMGAGMAIWTIVLTIIAMYVGGLETTRFAGVSTHRDGIAHGLMMFGLTAMSAIVVMSLSNTTMNGAAVTTGMHSVLPMGISTGMEWTAFLSLFLGWLAAMGGASTGIGMERKNTTVHEVVSRPAA